MNLLSILKKLFTKDKRVYTTSLSNLKDFIKLPTREELNPELIEALNEYKKEYLKILSSKRTIVSFDLSNKNYNTEMNVSSKLILNLIDNENSEISFEKTNEPKGINKLKLTLTRLKLKAYLYNILKLRTEVTLRIIALTEIINEKHFLSPNKRNAVTEQINNLSSNFLAFTNEALASELEINRYLDLISTLDNSEFLPKQEETNLLNNYFNELKEMFKTLHLQIEDNNSSPLTQICLMEMELEKYVYFHKEELNSLKLELSTLKQETSYLENKDKLIEEITRLELKYKIFTKYGRNLTTLEEIKDLYKLKFEILTYNILRKPNLDLLSNSNITELECYKDIIFNKISNIMSGKVASIYNNGFSKYVIPSIKEILKNGKNEYSPVDILKSHEQLSFLLSFDNIDGLEEFLKHFKVDKNSVDTDYHKSFLSWENELSYFTTRTIMYLNDTRENIKIFRTIDKDPYYNLLKFCIHKPFKYQQLPEGLKSISKKLNLSERDKHFLEKLKAFISNNHIITPQSLKEIEFSIYNDIDIENIEYIELNDSAEYVNDLIFKEDMVIDTLIIPSSLKGIMFHSYTPKHIYYIPFYSTDTYDSKIKTSTINYVYLKNFSKSNISELFLDDLLTLLFKVKKVETINYPKGKNARFFVYKYKSIPNFKTITFLEGREEILEIKAEEINNIIKKVKPKCGGPFDIGEEILLYKDLELMKLVRKTIYNLIEDAYKKRYGEDFTLKIKKD